MEKKVALQIQHDQNWQKMLEISAKNGFQYVSMGLRAFLINKIYSEKHLSEVFL